MTDYTERDERYCAPHCDPSILHRPSTCQYCDMWPDWQRMREHARINYTGENDPDKAPCPSLHFRPADRRDQWGGNRAVAHGQDPPPMWAWTPGPTPTPVYPPGPPWFDRMLERLYDLIWRRRG